MVQIKDVVVGFFLIGLLAVAFSQTAAGQRPIDGADTSTEPGAASDRKSRQKQDAGGWTITGFFGASHTASSRLRISQPMLGTDVTFDEVELRGESFRHPLYYGFRGSYFFRKLAWLGIEGEFVHLKVFADAQQNVHTHGLYHGTQIDRNVVLGTIVQRYSISHGVNLFMANLAGRRAFSRTNDCPDGRFILSARVGGGLTLPHPESTIDNREQEQYQSGRGVWQIAGSAEARIWRRLYVLGEYKFTRTRQRGKIFAGVAESLLRTQHGIFGLSYHLN